MHKGFTLIEIMTVIVVIAILATIVVVSYNGTQNKANDSAVQSDLDAAAGLIEEFRVNLSSTRRFPASTTDLSSVTISASKKSYNQAATTNFVYCVNTTDYQTYALVALGKSGKSFEITQDGFQSSVFTLSSFTNASTLCSGIGLALVSSGMSSPNTWQSWVNGS
jgi:type IV pilus assembly protein PilE